MEDDDRCGRMETTVTPENIPRKESLIEKDPKMTYAELPDAMKISSGSLICILHNCLGVRKRCARWVLHNLCEEQKWSRVDWCTHMLRKFDVATIPFEERKTVTADWYVNHCIPKVFQAWCKRRLRAGAEVLSDA